MKKLLVMSLLAVSVLMTTACGGGSTIVTFVEALKYNPNWFTIKSVTTR